MPTNYELTIIFSPLLADEDVKKEVARYTKILTEASATILEERHWGLRQLAYPIDAKSNGIYYIMEFAGDGNIVQKMEVEMKRDENILRWLTVRLDKYGMEYNDKRRKGLVGKKKETADERTARLKKEEEAIPQTTEA